jgi:hypothetical protein
VVCGLPIGAALLTAKPRPAALSGRIEAQFRAKSQNDETGSAAAQAPAQAAPASLRRRRRRCLWRLRAWRLEARVVPDHMRYGDGLRADRRRRVAQLWLQCGQGARLCTQCRPDSRRAWRGCGARAQLEAGARRPRAPPRLDAKLSFQTFERAALQPRSLTPAARGPHVADEWVGVYVHFCDLDGVKHRLKRVMEEEAPSRGQGGSGFGGKKGRRQGEREKAVSLQADARERVLRCLRGP